MLKDTQGIDMACFNMAARINATDEFQWAMDTTFHPTSTWLTAGKVTEYANSYGNYGFKVLWYNFQDVQAVKKKLDCF